MHSRNYLAETAEIAHQIDDKEIDLIAYDLSSIRDSGGKVICVGLGGGAANASHAANDLRKLCGIRAYCPTDHAALFTATWNDEGPEATFRDYAKLEGLGPRDAILVFSVGGGTSMVSKGISAVCEASEEMGFRVFGILGHHGGATRKYAHRLIRIPPMSPERITPHTESFQMVVLHCLVSHPALQVKATKW